jgi:hypothetical protein
MYFSTNQYPELRGKTGQEKSKILKGAIDAYARSTILRFWIAVGILLASFWIPADFSSQEPSLWHEWIMAAITGLLFYAYLLFEINGPVYTAVRKYLKDRPNN